MLLNANFMNGILQRLVIIDIKCKFFSNFQSCELSFNFITICKLTEIMCNVSSRWQCIFGLKIPYLNA